MAAEEEWQTKLATVTQRTSFLFNNGVLSDVKFVVPLSTDGSESKKVIPAHKFVLAISSPVFLTMFYGQMAETKDSIELPDCDYESLLEFFRYIYSDKVNLSGSNVMKIYYLAKKYLMPLLAEKCSEYLEWILTPSDAFTVIHHAQEVDDKALEARCWKVIGIYTEEALTCDEFLSVKRFDIECLVNRTALDIKEVKLFKAVVRWATKECERQGLSPDGEGKRRIFGDEIVKAIRFPVMSQREFTSVVKDSHLLTDEELNIVMKYYSDEFTSPLPFSDIPRLKEKHSKGNRSDVNSCKRKSLKGNCADSLRYTEELLEETRFRCKRFSHSRLPDIFIDRCGLQFSVDKNPSSYLEFSTLARKLMKNTQCLQKLEIQQTTHWLLTNQEHTFQKWTISRVITLLMYCLIVQFIWRHIHSTRWCRLSKVRSHGAEIKVKRLCNPKGCYSLSMMLKVVKVMVPQ